MRALSRFLLYAVIALAAALWVLPARWLIVALPADWPLAVADASGTVWRGTALLAVGPPESRSTLPAPVTWQTGFAGGFHLELRHPWLDGPLQLRPGIGGVALSGRTLSLPAAVLAQFGAPFNTLQPAGQLQLRWPPLRVGGRLPAGELLTIDWNDAATALSLLRPIGHYRVAIRGENGDAATVALSTVSGPLVMEGKGRWTARAGFSFKGVARPAPGSSNEVRAALQAALSALGRRSGDDSILQVGR
ncbi:hypothetical protein GCM10023144_45810 [Pigmentiphaga soli]|uniref:Type II secretion system protein N n=1 Tax=Pigmentiphaga soli TaxID=1007095 RepID=A0ABP8HRE8_9BURK